MNKETESNSLIREIKAQLRQEKIIGHLKTNQKLIICFVSAAVFGLAVWASVSFYNQVQSKKYSAILHQAIIDEQKGELEKSTAALKQIYESNAPAGVKEIASLKYAAQILKNDQDQAAEIYLLINKNKRFDSYIREYSGLIALKILVSKDQKENQEKITQEKIIALESDLEKNSKILKYHIIEQKGINEWNNDNFKEANQVFQSLADNPEVSEVLKKRAVEMTSLYSSRFGDDKKSADQKVVEKKSEDQKVETKK